jgi:hypothetical protein
MVRQGVPLMAAARRAVTVTAVTARMTMTPTVRAQVQVGIQAATETGASSAGSVNT